MWAHLSSALASHRRWFFRTVWVGNYVSKIVQCMPSSFFCSSFLSSCPFSFSYFHSFLPLYPLSFLSQLLLCFISDSSFVLFFLCFVLCPYNTSSCPSSLMNLFASPLIHSFLSLYLDLLFFLLPSWLLPPSLSLSLSQWQTIWPQPGIFNGFITDCRMLLNWEQWLAETPGRSLTPRI